MNQRLGSTSALARLAASIVEAIERLKPGYFAMVMATGIVSIALQLLGMKRLSDLLLWVNFVVFPWLVLSIVIRAIRFGSRLWADLTNPQSVFTFFTLVAASNVLGIQLLARGQLSAAVALWVAAFVIWLCLGYFSIGVLTFANTRPISETVNPTWLIAIVGTQSLAVLGARLAPELAGPRSSILLLSLGLWGIGTALYVLCISLVASRFFFARLEPADMIPPAWIIMGATAISTLAGANLIAAAPIESFLSRILPVLECVTFLLWAWSSWWIPMLIAFGVWKHIIKKAPITYDPAFWSLVFPLGMYTVATYRAALVMKLTALQLIPPITVWVALLAWAVTFAGLFATLAVSAARTLNTKQP